MKALVKLEFQEYMNYRPEFEHRLIDADDLKASKEKIRQYIDHMNRTWSGGTYSTEIKVLTQMEALNFVNSDECNPDMREELRNIVLNDYYDGLYKYDKDEPWYNK